MSCFLPIQRPTWLPTYLPELDGLRGLAILAVVLYHCNPRLEGTWIYYASLWGWAGVILFFGSQRISDHIHPADHARQAALLSQLSCAPGAAHLAGVSAAAGGGLPECAVVHRPQRVGGDQDRAVAGLHFLRAEPVSSDAAAGDRSDVGAGHRGAVLLCVGAGGALAARAVDACSHDGSRAGRFAAGAPCQSALDDVDQHAHSSGWHCVGQPAGDRAAHFAAEPARVAGDGPGRVGAGISGGGHHCRRHGVSGFGAGRGICRRGAGADCIHRRAQPRERGAALAGRWLSTAASATAST